MWEKVKDLSKAEEAFKVLQKAVEKVKTLANTRLGNMIGAEFGSRMNKMDEYTKNLYIADPEKWIANYGKGGKYNSLKQIDLDWKFNPIQIIWWKFRDSRWYTATGNRDFVIESGRLVFGERHSYISNGRNVDYAWTIQLNNNGEIIGWSNRSGHYLPTVDDKWLVVIAFKQQFSTDISNALFTSY